MAEMAASPFVPGRGVMHFSSLSESSGVRHALALNQEAGELLSRYIEGILRGPSPLDIGEREFIAAYVSGLNRCRYCHETHLAAAKLFGIDPGLVRLLVDDPALTSAPPQLRPLLAFARKLTLEHENMSAEDAQQVFDMGWSERALHDTILIACMFNFMNRFVHGHGILGDEEQWSDSGRYLFDHGYADIVEQVSAIRETAAV